MSTPFIGEIRMVGFNFAPVGWAFCNGAILAISQNDALFALIGTTYGGDGQTTFALPNLCSRVPTHMGQGAGLSNRMLGEMGGTEMVTLTTQQIPAHNHGALAQPASANQLGAAGNDWATSTLNLYGTAGPPNAAMNAGCLAPAGGSQPHDNMLPFQCINFVIALEGIFPPQN